MASRPNRDDGAFSDGFAIPITGLLAFVFALMAGMTVLPALSGSLGDLALPVIFGAASVLCFRLRQQYLAARDGE
ncbi:hypothetical protein [Halalkalicoccus ordinarius]|uniref:hypothetical protein n=1 Tax=Halalkalicoccus ordinarius TaxID=3116651 RepID=UPI00300F1AF0